MRTVIFENGHHGNLKSERVREVQTPMPFLLYGQSGEATGDIIIL